MCLGITYHWFCSTTGLKMKKGDRNRTQILKGPDSPWEQESFQSGKAGHRTSWSSFGELAGQPKEGTSEKASLCGPQTHGDMSGYLFIFGGSGLRCCTGGLLSSPPVAQASLTAVASLVAEHGL